MARINFICPNELSPPTDLCDASLKENAAPQQQTSVQVTHTVPATNDSPGKDSAICYPAILPVVANDASLPKLLRPPRIGAFSPPTTSAPANIGRRRVADLSKRLASTPPHASRWQQMEDIFGTQPSSASASHPTTAQRPGNESSPSETAHERTGLRRLQSEYRRRSIWDDNVLAQTCFTPTRLLGPAKDAAPPSSPLLSAAHHSHPQPVPPDQAIDAWLNSTENASDTSSDEWTGDEDFLPRSSRERHRWQRIQLKRAQRRKSVQNALVGACTKAESEPQETSMGSKRDARGHVEGAASLDNGVDSVAASDRKCLAMQDGPMSVAFRERLDALRLPVVGAGRFTKPCQKEVKGKNSLPL